jgi:hypothetical protein
LGELCDVFEIEVGVGIGARIAPCTCVQYLVDTQTNFKMTDSQPNRQLHLTAFMRPVSLHTVQNGQVISHKEGVEFGGL